MAPPTHSNSHRHEEYGDYLVNHNFKENPRLAENANRLSAWLEFLLHPETHDHDREVYGPFESTGGTWVWREQSERMYNYDTGDGEEYKFRSVLHEYRYSDFLDPLVALSTQQVETGANLLAVATAAVRNIYWVGQQFTHELANFPSEWKGPAAVEAERFVTRLESVASQLNLVVGELKDLLPKYGLVIKAARIDLDEAVAWLVESFEEKFRTKSEDGFSFDITGLVISVIAAAAVTYMTGGSTAMVTTAVIADAWSATFKEAADNLFREEDRTSVGTIQGYWWKDLAESYMNTKDAILRDATDAINQLNSEMTQLARDFEGAVPKFEDGLPEVHAASRFGG